MPSIKRSTRPISKGEKGFKYCHIILTWDHECRCPCGYLREPIFTPAFKIGPFSGRNFTPGATVVYGPTERTKTLRHMFSQTMALRKDYPEMVRDPLSGRVLLQSGRLMAESGPAQGNQLNSHLFEELCRQRNRFRQK